MVTGEGQLVDGTDTSPDRLPGTPLRDVLERALASGLPQVRRLRYARTSVGFALAGGGVQATLLLDRNPPVVAGPDEPAEVTIELDALQARRFAAGALSMPTEVIQGSVRTRGPVRKYLEVDPILRTLLAGAAGEAGEHGQATGNGAARAPGDGIDQLTPVDPSLLAIETRDLHKRFGTHEVLAGVNLMVPEGMISVVLGPSGTGKSVLLKHIIGLLKADAGDVVIRGRPYSRMSRSQILALHTEIGVMFQDGALFSAMNVYDNVAFPLRQHTDLNESEIRDVVMEQVASVGLVEAIHRLPNQLSGGMKKRAGLARALAMDPGIVLCDEPDSGLDPVRVALLADLLVEQHGRVGGTMLVITHNIDLARHVSEHISVLWQGKVLEAGVTDAILNSDDEFVRQFLAGEAVGPLGMD
jgi:phospholipid/cholesterol/gamma-HCH transport system ATP-binding protein